MSKQPEMVIARNPRATRNNDTTLNLDNQMYQQPVTSFQRVSNDAPLSEETKTAIQNTVLQFYVHSQPQEEAEGITACYERLSQEDKLDGESNSIANQKKILLKYATDNHFSNPTFFIDDGVSGVTFDRPGWNEMIRLAEAGKVQTVIVKDMSRMGRDYLKVGYYTESFFAERDIRYIAINDGVDSDKGDNDFTPFRNLFNDFYARDTSKKIRTVMRAKGNAGEHLCTNPPYGYMKDPADKKKWIVDEEAAEIVKRIFDLCIAGKGPMQIAKLLTAEHILTVKAHYAQRAGKPLPEKPYHWDPKSVAGILERPEYTGCTVNFKTYSKSHKLKKRLYNVPENQRIFPNTQPAIIDEQVFVRVQELRENKRRPAKQAERHDLSAMPSCDNQITSLWGRAFPVQQSFFFIIFYFFC